jgi:hypothetical protein
MDLQHKNKGFSRQNKRVCQTRQIIQKPVKQYHISAFFIEFRANFDFDVQFWQSSLRIYRGTFFLSSFSSPSPSQITYREELSPMLAANCFYVTGTEASRNKNKEVICFECKSRKHSRNNEIRYHVQGRKGDHGE